MCVYIFLKEFNIDIETSGGPLIIVFIAHHHKMMAIFLKWPLRSAKSRLNAKLSIYPISNVGLAFMVPILELK